MTVSLCLVPVVPLLQAYVELQYATTLVWRAATNLVIYGYLRRYQGFVSIEHVALSAVALHAKTTSTDILAHIFTIFSYSDACW